MSRAPASPAVSLRDAAPSLTLFARAIAGHDVTLQTRADADCIALPRPRPLADAGAIGLPAECACFAAERDNRAAYRIAVLRQALALECQAAAPPECEPERRGPLWRRLFHALEWLRIDHAIARDYPGARADLERLRALARARRRVAPSRGLFVATIDALERLAIGDNGTAPLFAAADAATAQLDTQALWAAVRAWAMPLAQASATAGHSARAATQIAALLGATRRARAALAASLHDVERQRNGGLPAAGGDTEPVAQASPLALPMSAQTGAAAPSGAGASLVFDSQAPGSWWSPAALRRVPLPADGGVRELTPGHSARPASPTPEGRAFAIDEWNCHAQRHHQGWCTLYEQRLHGDHTDFIRGVLRRHAALARAVRRRFALLRAEALHRVHGADDGDELELERVIESHVDRRAGRLDNRSAYLRRDRAQRDVCAAFLVDTSASTDYVLRVPPAAADVAAPAVQVAHDEACLYDLAQAAATLQGPPPRRVIDVAKDALGLMCDALQVLGDPFAVYAFSGNGRAQVEFRVAKDFADAVSARTAGALAALRPQGATRAGAAIRHAAAKLARQPQRSKLLILVTDGYPEDIDYGPEPRDLRYAIEDTAHALREAQALGVGTFCLSIDPAGHDYLRRMCPPQRYLVIDDVAALPAELSKVYQALTQ